MVARLVLGIWLLPLFGCERQAEAAAQEAARAGPEPEPETAAAAAGVEDIDELDGEDPRDAVALLVCLRHGP